MLELLAELIRMQSILALLLIFGFLPGLVLRLVVLLYPKGHPRRGELIGELYARPRWERPWFVAEQLEVALSEGLPTRVRPIARALIRRVTARRAGKARPTGDKGMVVHAEPTRVTLRPAVLRLQAGALTVEAGPAPEVDDE
jgi:hypothetical protein